MHAMWFTLLVAAALAAPDVFRFASGLRVVAEHRPGTPWMATAMAFAQAGQGDAEKGQEQLAHLVEHLWYRVGDHDARLHAMGCEFQAITWPRTMEFLTTCPADAFERQLDLEAAKLTGEFTGLDEATLALERDVVAIEIGAYREVDAAVVARAIASQMERDLEVRARLARGGLGSPQSV
ncbi:MAG: insulinase family protein, partial [Myxococcota bacterium]